MPRSVSIVVACDNEEDTLEPLYEQICAAFAGRDCVFELILVNDGSTDLSAVAAQKLAASRPGVRLINFRTNFGKAAALSAGFERARGDVLIPLDAALQDDPAAITRCLEHIDKGRALVSGWKQTRHDPLG